ncbi:MAG: nitrous oxide reductase accessory protein NosL [Halioglobus sp.]|nr:nitrous oxide reductase accessory protein NosL [Halioglobus sp.]
MVIADYPGPKGEAFLRGDVRARKFCSTLELFSFLRQPENHTQASHAYVHDSGATDWERPDDRFFIRAEGAWYVVGHDRRGAMNHTLAPFASRDQALKFRDEHGGEIVRYEDIDLALLGRVARGELRNSPSG